MHRYCYSLLITLLAAPTAHAANREWSLPDDPRAVVVALQYKNNTTGRISTALQLHRDGTFVGDVGAAAEVRSRISVPAMRELLHDILQTNSALTLSSRGLREQIEQESRRVGKPPRVRGARDVIVRITLADQVHEFQCRSPEVLRTRYPRLGDLDRVCSIRRRLENVVAVARAGGASAAERLAALAADELHRRSGAAVRVTARDLQSVRGETGDLRQAQFVVRQDRSGAAGGQDLHISVIEAAGAPPRISITTPAAPL